MPSYDAFNIADILPFVLTYFHLMESFIRLFKKRSQIFTNYYKSIACF